jgi:SagB-type dehydrogenase family enzyme
MTGPDSDGDATLAYHARSKHHLDRYAAGPETLDWDAQPNPYRDFAGAARVPLAFGALQVSTRYGQLHAPDSIPPATLSHKALSAVLEMAFGLSAWKEYGPDRWALRCNPSSGNLHPTEAYVLARGLTDLPDGLYHYVSRDHMLEQRRVPTEPSDAPPQRPQLWIGLSSIYWREAWKYGERGFRYCQLDIGHAVAALRYAAATLGWRATLVEGLDREALAKLLGLDRPEDFSGVEQEEPDLLIRIAPDADASPPPAWPDASQWHGRANLLDPHPMYRWPAIDVIATATRGDATIAAPAMHAEFPSIVHPSSLQASRLILARRSAQRFTAKSSMKRGDFYRMLDCLLPRDALPWDVCRHAPHLHPVFFVHRVEGIEPGLYALVRSSAADCALRDALRSDFLWQRPEHAPAHLPFYQLSAQDCRRVARDVSCHQAIAGESCFSLSMLGEFQPMVSERPWMYRHLHWEAGMLGHVLYLEAEAAGLRGTGIGCFFDDAVHALLGIVDDRFQAIYHFTLGQPLADPRIATEPGYPGRDESA